MKKPKIELLHARAYGAEGSALGQSRRSYDVRVTSAFPPIAAVRRTSPDFAFVPMHKDGSASSREFSWLIPKLNKHLNVHAPFIHAYPWLSAQTLGLSKYVDAIVAMTPIVMAASAKLNTANDQAL